MAGSVVCTGLQKLIRALQSCVWAGVLLGTEQGLLAQSAVMFEASLQAKEVVVNSPFELTFTLQNAEGQRFTPPTFPGLKKGAISETRGATIINGRSSIRQSWSLELTPTKAGVVTIGPASVVVNGKTMTTNPLTIQVLSAPKNSPAPVNIPPGSDDKIFISADFEPKEAFLGQQVVWRIRLFTQMSVEGYDIISLPDFEGFFSKEKIRYDKRVTYQTLRGKKYAVRTLHEEAVFPQEAGEITVGVARVSVGIEQPGAQGFLFGPKPVTLQTQSATLQVRTLPQPAPPSFTGGVGQYSWQVLADTSALTTDDALTLLVEVSGNGDARRLGAPAIQVPSTCEIFEPRILEEEEYEAESDMRHRKKFEYVVLPKDTGQQEITAVLAYFNLDSNRYVVLSSQAIRFAVAPGKNYQPSNAAPIPLLDPARLKPPSWGEQLLEGFQSPVFWGIFLMVVITGIWLYLRRNRKVIAAPTPAPKPSAAPAPPLRSVTASGTLQAAQQAVRAAGEGRQQNPAIFYKKLFKSIQDWLSIRYQISTTRMNEQDVADVLRQRGASPIRIQALRAIWHTCEQAIYGGQAQAEQVESTWQMANQIMEALDRETT